MKVWITTYALSDGISEHEGRETHVPTMIGYGDQQYAHGDNWHTTKEAAIAKAETMRIKKIASLKKQITNLEKLDFK